MVFTVDEPKHWHSSLDICFEYIYRIYLLMKKIEENFLNRLRVCEFYICTNVLSSETKLELLQSRWDWLPRWVLSGAGVLQSTADRFIAFTFSQKLTSVFTGFCESRVPLASRLTRDARLSPKQPLNDSRLLLIVQLCKIYKFFFSCIITRVFLSTNALEVFFLFFYLSLEGKISHLFTRKCILPF